MNPWVGYSLLAVLGTGFLGMTGDPPSSQSNARSLPGITKPWLHATLHPNIAGQVQAILVKEGERVKAGQPLVRMDDRVALANLATAEIAAAQTGPVELARAELVAAEQSLRRLESVRDNRAVAAQDLETARAAVEKARANLTTAEGNLRLAQEKLVVERERVEQLTIAAPFDGSVHHIRANLGERLLENQPVLELVDTSTLKVELYVASELHTALKIGTIYRLQTEFRSLQWVEAKLTSIAPIIDPSTDTLRCIFEITNASGEFPAGFVVQFGGEPADTGRYHER